MSTDWEKQAELEMDNYVRRLRENIYGVCSDKGWLYVKPNWSTRDNVRWLEEHQPKSVTSD